MKKKQLIAISFLVLLASCQSSGTTSKYDGKAVLRELESKKRLFVFSSREETNADTITDEKGRVLAQGDGALLGDDEATIVKDGVSYLYDGSELKRQDFAFLSPNYGGIRFYKDSADGLYGIADKEKTSLLSPTYSHIEWMSEGHYLAKAADGFYYGGSSSERHLIEATDVDRLLSYSSGAAVFELSDGSYQAFSNDGAPLFPSPFAAYSVLDNLLFAQNAGVYDIEAQRTYAVNVESVASHNVIGRTGDVYAVKENNVWKAYHQDELLSLPEGAEIWGCLQQSLFVRIGESLSAFRADGKTTQFKNWSLSSSLSIDYNGDAAIYSGTDGKQYLYNDEKNKLFAYGFDSLIIPGLSFYPNTPFLYTKGDVSGLLNKDGVDLFRVKLESGEYLLPARYGAVIQSDTSIKVYGPVFDKPVFQKEGGYGLPDIQGFLLGFRKGTENLYVSMLGDVIYEGTGTLRQASYQGSPANYHVTHSSF